MIRMALMKYLWKGKMNGKYLSLIAFKAVEKPVCVGLAL